MVRLFVEALPRLTAEEQLGAIDVGTVANSLQFDKQGIDDLRRQLERRAGLHTGSRAKTAPPSHAELAAMGIAVFPAPKEQGAAHE